MNDCPGIWLPDGLPRGHSTIEAMARAAAEAVLAQRIERFDVIGVSLGGAVAQCMARDYPDNVRRVVLVSTSVGGMAALPSPWDLRTYAAAARLWSDALLGSRFGSVNLAELARRSLAAMGFESEGWLDQIRQQTLVVHGDADFVVPFDPNALLLSSQIPRAELYCVPGGTHYALVKRAREIARVVKEFMLSDDLVPA